MAAQTNSPKTKLCKGFKNIHFAPYVNGNFDRIKSLKNVNIIYK